MYTLSYTLSLGLGNTGLILKAQLLNTDSSPNGSEITTGFVEVGSGEYLWTYDGFPDGFRGGIKFYDDTKLWSLVSVNPQEAENLDVKVSSMSATSPQFETSLSALGTYGTVDEADEYFNNRLRADIWKSSTEADKQSALIESTRMIDRLNFRGDKTDPEQVTQFPRNGDTEIPAPIAFACFELAQRLLDDLDPDMSMDNIQAQSRGYSSVRSTYDRSFVPDYVGSGIPSSNAWSLLLPYLRDPREMVITQ